MSFRTRTVVAITAVALAALSGCAPEPPPIVPEPTSTTPPLFASDEEALAAAEEAYREYLRVSDAIFLDGGRDADRIDAVSSASHAKAQRDAFAQVLEAGARGTGTTAFDSFELQQFDATAEGGESIISIYTCLDLSDTDTVDATGKSIVAKDRKLRVPLEVHFDLVNPNSKSLVIGAVDFWSGEDFCS